jgi:hypothetical protein
MRGIPRTLGFSFLILFFFTCSLFSLGMPKMGLI